MMRLTQGHRAGAWQGLARALRSSPGRWGGAGARPALSWWDPDLHHRPPFNFLPSKGGCRLSLWPWLYELQLLRALEGLKGTILGAKCFRWIPQVPCCNSQRSSCLSSLLCGDTPCGCAPTPPAVFNSLEGLLSLGEWHKTAQWF